MSYTDGKEFLTGTEFRELFKISPTTFGRWIKEGKIKVIRIGRTVRVPASEVDRLIEENTEDNSKR